MEKLDLISILNRKHIVDSLVNKLRLFFMRRDDPLTKRGFYVFGAPGTGKTELVLQSLKEAGFDVVRYDAGDIRNKNVIESITKNQMADVNIMSLWKMKEKKIVIVMDEIDGMNSGDKGGINALIKLIRPKKTKKQKNESNNYNPIVCIGNYHVDKKITDLMKVCETFEVPTPTPVQVANIVKQLIPQLETNMETQIVQHVQGDLRRLSSLLNLINKGLMADDKLIQEVLSSKSQNANAKDIVKKLMNHRYSLAQHADLMNETDRTIVGLLWHENIIDVLKKQKKASAVSVYASMLNSMCIGDYLDRVTFQKQMWQFNEMSSLIKTLKGNQIYHDSFVKIPKYDPNEVRFTKVLTKYSTEFNNFIFIQALCQKLGMDRKDLFAYFSMLKSSQSIEDIIEQLELYDVSKLEIERMFRFIDSSLDTISDLASEPQNSVIN